MFLYIHIYYIDCCDRHEIHNTEVFKSLYKMYLWKLKREFLEWWVIACSLNSAEFRNEQ